VYLPPTSRADFPLIRRIRRMALSWLPRFVRHLLTPSTHPIHRPACRQLRLLPAVEFLEERCQPSGNPIAPGTLALQQIDHFVVIYQENWSFDGLYGKFPGANGLANATDANGNLLISQVDKNDNAITTLPNPSTDLHVPGGLPAKPFDLSQ